MPGQFMFSTDMSIQQQVVLRYRAPGHLRFALPAMLCEPRYESLIVAGLQSIEGVYRVALYPRQGKLSIRFAEEVCGFSALVRRLHELLRAVPAQDPLPAISARGKAVARGSGEMLGGAGALVKKTAAAITRHPQWVTDFGNDLLMLYLLRVHWHQITQLWLPNPWRYRYEWAATLYSISLLVRSKIPPRLRD